MKTSMLDSLNTPFFNLKPCVIYFYPEYPRSNTYTAFVYDDEFVISFRASTTVPYRYHEQDIEYYCIKKDTLPPNITVESLKTLMGVLRDCKKDSGVKEHWDLKILKTKDTSVPMLLDHLHGNERKPTVHTTKTSNIYVMLGEILLALKEAELFCPTYSELMEKVEGLSFSDAVAVLEQFVNIIFDDAREDV